MVKASNSHGHANGVFISPGGWRKLAGDNIPGSRSAILRPEGVLESTVGRPIRPICRIRPILPHPKSTFANPKSTVDLGCEPLIKVENSLSYPSQQLATRPISTP